MPARNRKADDASGLGSALLGVPFARDQARSPLAPVDFAALYRRLDTTDSVLETEESWTSAERVEARIAAITTARGAALLEGIDVLIVLCGGRRLALRIEDLDQALDASGVSALPGMPRHILGAIVARTHILPVLDLRVLLGLDGGGMADLTRVLVSRHSQPTLAIAVELLEEQRRLPLLALRPPPEGPFLFAADEELLVIDLDALKEPASAAD
jgi:purine-binding chemotaxis protein CheW